MQQSGNKQDAKDYIQAWAVMMIRIWQDKQLANKIRPGELFKSFTQAVQLEANGDVAKITHTFLMYGRMVDMGVGSGTTKAEADTPGHRRSRKWYNKSYYVSTKKLDEVRMKMYGEEFQSIILDTLKF